MVLTEGSNLPLPGKLLTFLKKNLPIKFPKVSILDWIDRVLASHMFYSKARDVFCELNWQVFFLKSRQTSPAMASYYPQWAPSLFVSVCQFCLFMIGVADVTGTRWPRDLEPSNTTVTVTSLLTSQWCPGDLDSNTIKSLCWFHRCDKKCNVKETLTSVIDRHRLRCVKSY